MHSPKISVIVPVFNAERWLPRCIDSILAQTFTDFELLLIDDGSTDGSGAICDAYAARDPRIRVFHKPNGGVSSARNLGLDHARGAWITFCDSDDRVDPTWLEAMHEGTDGGYDLVSCGFHLYKSGDTAEDMVSHEFAGSNKEYLGKIVSEEMFGSLCNKLFRAAIIARHNLRLDARIKFREDEEFLLRYMTRCRSGRIVPVAAYHYIVPDWNKYSGSINYENGLLLMTSLCKSLNEIGLKGAYSIRIHRNYFDFLKVVACKRPFIIFHHLKPFLTNLIYYKFVLKPTITSNH